MSLVMLSKSSGKVRFSGDPPLLTGGYRIQKGCKKLKYPVFETSLTQQPDNIILIDWLSVTCHGFTVEQALDLLGVAHCPFEEIVRYMSGYPARLYWNGISILFGCDNEKYVPSDQIRKDMGISIQLSGQGCRAYETYGSNDWISLLSTFITLTDVVKEKNGRKFSFNITRLDLAFDDHTGIFDIYLMANKVKDREFRSISKWSDIVWSDDQESDLQGICINIGSPSSDIKFRIYDKAAERGFNDRHWVRLECQLRSDRAYFAMLHILKYINIGVVLRGIIANYLDFVEPSSDSNRSRWPVSDWWLDFLQMVEEIKLTCPGTEYNISRSEFYQFRQYGQLMVALSEIHGDEYLISKARALYPVDELDTKYKNILKSLQIQEGILNEKKDFI